MCLLLMWRALIRKSAAGFDICFLHPKGSDELPIGGEGVLIELVQAPPEVVQAFAVLAGNSGDGCSEEGSCCG